MCLTSMARGKLTEDAFTVCFKCYSPVPEFQRMLLTRFTLIFGRENASDT